jgi:type VI secretion system secreted protein Hcp
LSATPTAGAGDAFNASRRKFAEAADTTLDRSQVRRYRRRTAPSDGRRLFTTRRCRSMAFACYVTIEGDTQGKFKAEGSFSKFGADKIGVVIFSSGVVVPHDAATGQPTGKRQHQTVKFTKQWGAASPQLFQALVQNETLKTVVFTFTRTTAQGKEEVHWSVTLTNASVVAVRPLLDLTTRTGSSFDGRELEQVELTFEKIEIEDKAGKTTAADDWGSGS